MNDRWSDRLSDYLDDQLDAAERAAIETHLATCDDCAHTLEALREVTAQARRIENAAPARDLWRGIEARIAAGPARGGSPGAGAPAPLAFRARFVPLTWPQALAAGFALVMLSGGAMWWALRGSERGGGGHSAGAGAMAKRVPA